MTHTAVGVHVFAGGFTRGVLKAGYDVACQLEAHNFGYDSAPVPVIHDAWSDWPTIPGEFAFGNPRCTAFSAMTAGYTDSAHGPFAKQTCDIHDLCRYAAGSYDAVCWESVQQAYTVGRPLLDYIIKEYFLQRHYRIAHLFLNAASFGNTQQRKRYFFVAYRDDRNFNVVPPDVPPKLPVLADAIHSQRNRECRPVGWRDKDYGPDHYMRITKDEVSVIPHMPNGWDLHLMARYAYEYLPEKYQFIWDTRCSDMPFSMHGLFRLNWLRPAPTLHSSAARFVHPEANRPMSIGELSTVMGWDDDIPKGLFPVSQLAKGVVPCVGEWLARQVSMYLEGGWGAEDWESSYDPVACEWKGGDAHGKLEKTFDLTKYSANLFDLEDYPHVTSVQPHRRDISRRRPVTARRIDP